MNYILRYLATTLVLLLPGRWAQAQPLAFDRAVVCASGGGLYGWGPTRERVHYPAPHGHWKTTTFVAAFRLGGMLAPMVVDGALDGELFAKYVRQELAPRLRPGDILVMDNLATPKVKAAADAVRAVDAGVLYLPPYSPDLNPIEQVFSKIKTELRRRELRTITALENAFGESLDWITPTDALHYFEHSGYAGLPPR